MFLRIPKDTFGTDLWLWKHLPFKKKKVRGSKIHTTTSNSPPPQHDRSKGMFGMRETTWGCDSSAGKGHQCGVSHYISDCHVIMSASNKGVCGRQSAKSHSNPETRNTPTVA